MKKRNKKIRFTRKKLYGGADAGAAAAEAVPPNPAPAPVVFNYSARNGNFNIVDIEGAGHIIPSFQNLILNFGNTAFAGDGQFLEPFARDFGLAGSHTDGEIITMAMLNPMLDPVGPDPPAPWNFGILGVRVSSAGCSNRETGDRVPGSDLCVDAGYTWQVANGRGKCSDEDGNEVAIRTLCEDAGHIWAQGNPNPTQSAYWCPLIWNALDLGRDDGPRIINIPGHYLGHGGTWGEGHWIAEPIRPLVDRLRNLPGWIEYVWKILNIPTPVQPTNDFGRATKALSEFYQNVTGRNYLEGLDGIGAYERIKDLGLRNHPIITDDIIDLMQKKQMYPPHRLRGPPGQQPHFGVNKILEKIERGEALRNSELLKLRVEFEPVLTHPHDPERDRFIKAWYKSCEVRKCEQPQNAPRLLRRNRRFENSQLQGRDRDEGLNDPVDYNDAIMERIMHKVENGAGADGDEANRLTYEEHYILAKQLGVPSPDPTFDYEGKPPDPVVISNADIPIVGMAMEPEPVLETDDSKITVASVNCWDLGQGWRNGANAMEGGVMRTVDEYDLFRRYMDSIALQNPDLIFLQEAPGFLERGEFKPIFANDENYQKYELVSIHSPNSCIYEPKYGRPDNSGNDTPAWKADPRLGATSQQDNYFSCYENMMTLRRKDSPWILSEGGEHVLITKNCKTKRVSTIQTFKNRGDTEVTIANIHLCGGVPDEKYMARVWHTAALKQGLAWCKLGAIAKTDDEKLGMLIFIESSLSPDRPPVNGVLRFSDGSERHLRLDSLTQAMESETTDIDFGEPPQQVDLPEGWGYRWHNGKPEYYPLNDSMNGQEDIPVAPAPAVESQGAVWQRQAWEEGEENLRHSVLPVEEIKGEQIIDILDKNPDIVLGDFNSDYGVVLNHDPNSPSMRWLTDEKYSYGTVEPGFPRDKAFEWHRAPYDILSRNNFIRARLDDPNKPTNINGGITDCVWFSDKRLQEIDGKVLDVLKVPVEELRSKNIWTPIVIDHGNLNASDHNGIISTLQIKSPVDLGMGGGKRSRRTNRRRKKRKIRTNIKSRKNKVNRKSRKTKKKQ